MAVEQLVGRAAGPADFPRPRLAARPGRRTQSPRRPRIPELSHRPSPRVSYLGASYRPHGRRAPDEAHAWKESAKATSRRQPRPNRCVSAAGIHDLPAHRWPGRPACPGMLQRNGLPSTTHSSSTGADAAAGFAVSAGNRNLRVERRKPAAVTDHRRCCPWRPALGSRVGDANALDVLQDDALTLAGGGRARVSRVPRRPGRRRRHDFGFPCARKGSSAENMLAGQTAGCTPSCTWPCRGFCHRRRPDPDR